MKTCPSGWKPDDAEDILERAERRRQQAFDILKKLGLMESWSRFGQPKIVGAVRYGLVVAPDIDIAIYSDQPLVSQGFDVMRSIAEIPGVWKVRFSNELNRSDQGLYWQVRYIASDETIWKVDNWLLSENHPQADWDERFALALDQVLTTETRRAILRIKEDFSGQEGVRGIDIYQAVLEGDVRSPSALEEWMAALPPVRFNYWLPSG